MRHALAVGDFDNDGATDRVIGIQGAGIGARDFGGALLIIEGSTSSFLDDSSSRAIDESRL